MCTLTSHPNPSDVHLPLWVSIFPNVIGDLLAS
jgi:hypothetical protein